MQPIMVYMTAESMDQAKTIARELISARLAACVNILDHMQSLYWWEGKVEESGEVVVLAKTRAELLPTLTERVQAVHSYDCPCIVSWPITDGHQPFLDWIEQETASAVG
jgi:periplasmic divalent cation tolerance protein